jgi:cation:H+ antiporter
MARAVIFGIVLTLISPGETFGLRCPHLCRASDVVSAIAFSLARPRFSSMALSVVLFLLCAAAIYLSCEYFVNGVEWVGRRLGVGATATGTVLAAFGTALPESAVTFIAVVFGRDAAQKDIGVGSAIGGPLVLSTISYAVVGVVLWSSHRKLRRDNTELQLDTQRLSSDQAWFLLIFIAVLALGLVSFPFKRWLGLLLFGAYALYVWREITARHGAEHDEEQLEPLKFRPSSQNPSLAWASLQTLIALGVIAVASHSFVDQLQSIGTHLGISSQLVALILSPVATELPETLNALIWVRQGRERLALANISGAMMIQATVPAGLGVLFTTWRFDPPLVIAASTASAAVVLLWLMFRRQRVSGMSLIPLGLLYVLFAIIVALVQRFQSI